MDYSLAFTVVYIMSGVYRYLVSQSNDLDEEPMQEKRM
jgi:hypothetical protein